MSDSQELIAAVSPVIDVLTQLSIRNYIAGSVASSYHGATRSTMDVDLVCELKREHVAAFVAATSDDFYVSESAIHEAVDRKACFNLIHYPTSFKVDLFVSKNREFEQEAMQRALKCEIGESPPILVTMATVEDVIISKLEWYQLSNQTSDRQWGDIEKLLELHETSLGHKHLYAKAKELGLVDLLHRALGDE